ncbi:MAG: hypothetical protein ACTSO4_15090 [Promethearchaeota archaeon]
MSKKLSVKDLVSLYPGYDTEVILNEDFSIDDLNNDKNLRKIQSYYPKPDCRRSLEDISEGLEEISEKRSFLITGTYGTGKSHLGLIIANYLSMPSEDKRLEPLFFKIKERNPIIAQKLIKRRQKGKPFLIVLPDFLINNFETALIKGLKEAFEKAGVNFSFKTKYQNVIDYIESIKKESEDIYRLLNEKLQNKYGIGLSLIKDSLSAKN